MNEGKNNQINALKKLKVLTSFSNSNLREQVNNLKGGNNDSAVNKKLEWYKIAGTNTLFAGYQEKGKFIINNDITNLEKGGNKIPKEVDFALDDDINDYGGKKRKKSIKPTDKKKVMRKRKKSKKKM